MGHGESDRGIVVRCSCGASYTLAEWSKLELAGIQDEGDESDPRALWEYRNCTCGSTRARQVDFRAAVRLLNDTTKKLRTALGRLRDIDRVTHGLASEISELDRGIVRNGNVSLLSAAVEAVALERERCARVIEDSSLLGLGSPLRELVQESIDKIRNPK